MNGLAGTSASLLPAIDLGKVSDIVTNAQETIWNQSNEVLRIISKAFSASTWWISELCKVSPSTVKEWEDQKFIEREMVKVAMELYEREKSDAKKEGI